MQRAAATSATIRRLLDLILLLNSLNRMIVAGERRMKLQMVMKMVQIAKMKKMKKMLLGLDYHVSEIHMLFSGFSHVVLFFMLE